jgi:hypothetical protein
MKLGLIAKGIAIVFAGLGGFVVWALWAEHTAENKARAFCDRIAVGSLMTDVARAAQGEGDERHRFIRSEYVSVAYIGATMFSRHACAVDGENGTVKTARYVYID